MTDWAALVSVITPVSRPYLLPLIQHSIPQSAEWILVSDGPVRLSAGLRPHRFVTGPATASWGNAQRALGIQKASREYLYFLDDDNLMLPDLPRLTLPSLVETGAFGVLFGLLAEYFGESHLWPAPSVVGPMHVDTAMFLGRRDAVSTLRFSSGAVCSGWPVSDGRGADCVFLREFEKKFGLRRAASFWGFHNGVDLLRREAPGLLVVDDRPPADYGSLLNGIVSDRLSRSVHPPWYEQG